MFLGSNRGIVGLLYHSSVGYVFRSFNVPARARTSFSIAGIIFEEITRAFSLKMLPWGLAFSMISALTGAFYGRNRQAITARRANKQRFKKMSITDELTGLYNSRHFFNRLKAEVERTDRYGHPLTLLILDFDNFKQYNDTFGI